VVHGQSAPETFTFAEDGQSIPVPDAITLQVDRTANGVTAPTDLHLARVQSKLVFFTDCGDPLPGR
jgi:hypothetical protein